MAYKRLELVENRTFGETPTIVDAYHISYKEDINTGGYAAILVSKPIKSCYEGPRIVTSLNSANEALSKMLDGIRSAYPNLHEYKEILSDMSGK